MYSTQDPWFLIKLTLSVVVTLSPTSSPPYSFDSSTGFEIALQLASSTPSPRELILVGPSNSAAGDLVEKIKFTNSSISVKVIEMNLASLESIRFAAARINNTSFQPIDGIFNTTSMTPDTSRGAVTYSQTEEGIERYFGVNHVGHFLFTNLLVSK
jgi:NAD(P)-dependent dehydrogenase (short-subunit alcohol dehydrogenase family)